MTPPKSRKPNPEREPGPGEDPGPGTPSVADLKGYAQRLLARREYGRHELAARLQSQWTDAPDADDAIAACVAELVEDGLLSDDRFAESFVRSRRRRAQGPVRIRAELKQRRVDAGAIADHLEDDDESWIGEAVDWLRRHAPAELNLKERARFYRRLLNRGFSHAQSMAALDRLSSGD